MQENNTLTKSFYKGQYDFYRRRLEEAFELLQLNATQKKYLREIIDNLLEQRGRELTAPEDTSI